MFERYSERARRTLFFSRYEASVLAGVEIEPEHILLGLLREGRRIHQFLGHWHISPAELRRQLETHARRSGPKVPTSVEIPFSPTTKRMLHAAMWEADRLVQRQIEPEHLVLGLLRENDPVAAASLTAHGMTLDGARDYVVTRLPTTPDMEGTLLPNPVAAAHIERITQLVHGLAQTQPDTPENRTLLQRIDDELTRLLRLMQ
jgi:ATP-dependent Clp protease ATP-binding subunit ClpC